MSHLYLGVHVTSNEFDRPMAKQIKRDTKCTQHNTYMDVYA